MGVHEPEDPQEREDQEVKQRRPEEANGAQGRLSRDGVPGDGVSSGSVPRDGMPRDGVPDDGVPRGGVPDDGRDEIVHCWLRYAAAERCHAARLRAEHDQPSDQLRDARAEARSQAAAVLTEATDLAAAADQMMAEARRLHIRVPPLLGFDEAMLSYTRARTWQACARELVPDLAEVQPRWSSSWVESGQRQGGRSTAGPGAGGR